MVVPRPLLRQGAAAAQRLPVPTPVALRMPMPKRPAWMAAAAPPAPSHPLSQSPLLERVVGERAERGAAAGWRVPLPAPRLGRRLFITGLGIGQIASWGTLYYSFLLIAERMGQDLGLSKP